MDLQTLNEFMCTDFAGLTPLCWFLSFLSGGYLSGVLGYIMYQENRRSKAAVSIRPAA